VSGGSSAVPSRSSSRRAASARGARPLGAAGLMGSALVEDAGPRTVLQIFGAITAVGFGAMASVLAWRWWGGRADR
jgi:hypothetical protein